MTVKNQPKNIKGETKMKKKKVTKRLKKFRMDSGYTIYTLGDKLNVNYSTVSNWERGDQFPRPQLLMKLEDLFGVTYRELFEDLSEEESHILELRKYDNYSNSKK